MRIKVKLNEVEKVKQFVKMCSKCEEDINVYAEHYIIDAKSLIAMFSLDLSRMIEVDIITDSNEKRVQFTTDIKLLD